MTFIFENLKNYLEKNSISIATDISDKKIFIGIGSLLNANNEQLTFFNNLRYISDLKKTNALGCFISKDHADLLPDNCKPIIVDSPYKSFALSTNFFF